MTKPVYNEPDPSEADYLVRRIRHLENFARWMLAAGLNPLDYELVEETRPDGVRLWYFRRRPGSVLTEAPPSADNN